MRKTLIIASLIIIGTTASAQTVQKVLEETATRLEQAGTAKADFKLTSFDGATEQGAIAGSIVMKGTKFHLTTPQMQIWFDGHTQWSMLTGSNEVNIQEPTEEEQARMNPYSFITLYKQGYKYKMTKAELRGVQTYEVTLQATSKTTALGIIVINIDPRTYTPLCIRLKHDNDWVRIAIYGLVLGETFDDSDFVFPTAQYPDATVIDLR